MGVVGVREAAWTMEFPVAWITALILAGGNSRRMGTDKALLAWEETCLLRETCRKAQAIAHQVYVVTPWGARHTDHIEPGCLILPEPRSPHTAGPGPLGAFTQALDGLPSQNGWLLLLACDLPYLTPEVLRQGASQLPSLPPETLAFLPQGPKGWEPLCGFYQWANLDSLKGFWTQGGRSFQRWLQGQPVVPWPLADPACLQNCNTPEDWQRFQRHLSQALGMGFPHHDKGTGNFP